MKFKAIVLLAAIALAIASILARTSAAPAYGEHRSDAGPEEVVKAYMAFLTSRDACRGVDECWNIDASMRTLFGPDYDALDQSRRRYVRDLFTVGLKAILVSPGVEELAKTAEVSAPVVKSRDATKATVEALVEIKGVDEAGGKNSFTLLLAGGEWQIVDSARDGKPVFERMKPLIDKGRAEGLSIETMAAAGAMGILKEAVGMEQAWRKRQKNAGQADQPPRQVPK